MILNRMWEIHSGFICGSLTPNVLIYPLCTYGKCATCSVYIRRTGQSERAFALYQRADMSGLLETWFRFQCLCVWNKERWPLLQKTANEQPDCSRKRMRWKLVMAAWICWVSKWHRALQKQLDDPRFKISELC